MVWLIARKELMENLMTFRFSLGTLILVLLLPLFTWLGIRDYNTRFENYQAQVENYAELQDRAPITYELILSHLPVLSPPQPLSIICKGISEQIAFRSIDAFELWKYPHIRRQAQASLDRRNVLDIFQPIDPLWVFLCVVSLLAMLLAYNSISGEKEGRSLPMVLSSSLSRASLFFGKYIGILICLFIPLVLGSIVSVLTIMILIPGVLNSADWFRLISVFFLLGIYGSVFVTLGLLVSALVHRSSTSLITLLLLWVCSVILIPLGAVHLARSLRPVPSRSRSQIAWIAFKEDLEKRPDLQLPDYPWRPLVPQYGIAYLPAQSRLRVRTPLPKEWLDDLVSFYRDKFPEFRAIARNRSELSYSHRSNPLISQAKMTRTLERISPTGAARHLAEAVLGTDYGVALYRLERCRRNWEVCMSYLKNKLYSDPYRVFTFYPVDSLPGEREYISHVTGGKYSTVAEVLREMKNEKDKEWGGNILVNWPKWLRTEKMKLDDLPEFDRRMREPFLTSLRRAMVDLATLLVFQIFLFAAGFVLIVRYDPR